MGETQTSTRRAWRLHEIPQLTGLSAATIGRAVRTGALRTSRPTTGGRAVLVRTEDLDAWLEGRSAR